MKHESWHGHVKAHSSADCFINSNQTAGSSQSFPCTDIKGRRLLSHLRSGDEMQKWTKISVGKCLMSKADNQRLGCSISAAFKQHRSYLQAAIQMQTTSKSNGSFLLSSSWLASLHAYVRFVVLFSILTIWFFRIAFLREQKRNHKTFALMICTVMNLKVAYRSRGWHSCLHQSVASDWSWEPAFIF